MPHPTPAHPARPVCSSLVLASSLILGAGCALLAAALALAILLARLPDAGS